MSNELKATKGPWYVTDPMGGVGHTLCKINHIYMVGCDVEPMEDAKGDAHLIAAAPELYEALDELLDSVIHSEFGASPSLIDDAIAALSKARGEKS